MRDRHVLEVVYGANWAIREGKLAMIVSIAEAHAAGLIRARAHEAAEQREARLAARAEAPQDGAIGVIPIHGVILSRSTEMTETSGVSTAQSIGAQFGAMVRDDRVSAVVLDIDSPGGLVQGSAELADQIFAGRGAKPIVAVAWNEAASAAYWIASAADEIVVTPTGEVGSVGVFAIHRDMSKALEDAGIKHTIIKAGKFKAEATPFEPLSGEARAYRQTAVDTDYGVFVRAIARGRGVSSEAVRNDFGEGRMVSAEQAVKLGMADRIGTFEETIRRLGSAQGRAATRRRHSESLRLRRSRHCA